MLIVNVMSAKLLLLNLNWLPVNETIKSVLLDIDSIYLKSLNLIDVVYISITITSISQDDPASKYATSSTIFSCDDSDAFLSFNGGR